MWRFSNTELWRSLVSRTATSTMARAQVVGPNHLVGEQHAKCRVDRAQHAVTKIRLPARLYGVDVGGAEDIRAREPRREECFLGLARTQVHNYDDVFLLYSAGP
jgi:hypothetical protein